MESDRVEIPTSFMERLLSDKRKLALVVGGALLVVVVLGLLVARAVTSGPLDTRGGPAVLEPIKPSGETSSTETTSSQEPTRTTGGEPGTAEGEAEQEEPDAARAALLAYRLDGALWVANEDGSKPVKIAEAPSGAFALSPDGTLLAWVDPSVGQLKLTPVGGGAAKSVGPALDMRPAWSGDSKRLGYTAPGAQGAEARVVSREGASPMLVGAGHSPSFSADGSTIAFVGAPTPGATGPVVLRKGSDAAKSLAALQASAVVFAGDELAYAVSGSGAGSERLMVAGLDGAALRQIAGDSGSRKPVAYASLCPSPDGTKLAYAATGDDGFSRTFVLELAEPDPVSLTVRRDTYPMCWSADGGRVFFIEGNAFQGEPTTLMSATPDGFGRRSVVEGAGL